MFGLVGVVETVWDGRVRISDGEPGIAVEKRLAGGIGGPSYEDSLLGTGPVKLVGKEAHYFPGWRDNLIRTAAVADQLIADDEVVRLVSHHGGCSGVATGFWRRDSDISVSKPVNSLLAVPTGFEPAIFSLTGIWG